MRRILIAGGSGLVGTSLTNLALKNNFIVQSSFKTKIQDKKISNSYKKFNFLSFKDCLKATKKIDCAVLCAVYASGIENMSRGDLFEQNLNNIIIRSNFFEACKINKVKNIVWVSSSTIYQPKKNKISEKELNLNKSPYEIYLSIGIAYRYIENLIDYYNRKHKMNIKIIRTTSIYGPFDNFDSKKSHVIPALIKKVFKEKKLKVWGDKNVIRDFVYVDDLSKVILELLKNKNNLKVNFSSATGTSIGKLANLVNKISKQNKMIIYQKSKPSSAKYRVLNNAKISKLIKIKRTNLEDGLKKTIDWYKKKYLKTNSFNK